MGVEVDAGVWCTRYLVDTDNTRIYVRLSLVVCPPPPSFFSTFTADFEGHFN